MSKKVKKKTKKVIKKVAKKVVKAKPKVIDSFAAEMEAFGLLVMDDTNDNDAACAYRIPFKNRALQKATGGIMGGKFAEISGDSQSGKSFLLYEVMAEAVKMGGVSLLYDGERALEESYANMVGLNMRSGKFALGETRSADQVKLGTRGTAIVDMDDVFKGIIKFIKIARKSIKDKSIPIIIGIDSYPSLTPGKDLENIEAGKAPRGYAAMQKNGKFSFWIEKLLPMLDEYAATLVLINQTRIDASIEYGDNVVTLCENVVKFHATQRIRGKLAKRLTKKVPSMDKKEKTRQYGMTTEWTIIKNRAVAPFQKVSLQVIYTKGILAWSGMDELLVNDGILRTGTTKSLATVKRTLGPKALAKLQVNKDGETLTKPFTGFKLINSDDVLFYATAKSVCRAHPELLEPKWTSAEAEDDDEYEYEEVDAVANDTTEMDALDTAMEQY